jgi:hypothetical protein
MITTDYKLGISASRDYIRQRFQEPNAGERIAEWFDVIAAFHGFSEVLLCVHTSSARIELDHAPSKRRVVQWLDEAWARTEAELAGKHYIDRPEDDCGTTAADEENCAEAASSCVFRRRGEVVSFGRDPGSSTTRRERPNMANCAPHAR